ncbi:MAG: YgiT-type zinc finger protein [Desulfobacteraceae bacterium]|nr:YgiT-type zinc finger protein [Desulfobacteraceae bacterium]
MKPFDKCPVCGGKLVEKDVEKLLHGGIHTAVVKVSAEVCLHCGERLYTQETVSRFQQIRDKLKRQEVSEFEPMGTSFRAVAESV